MEYNLLVKENNLMKAFQISKTGDVSVLELKVLPIPKPGPGEALIKLKAAGLNYIDIYIRSGRYSYPLPFTPGLEGAGIVEAIGDSVQEVKPGDRVTLLRKNFGRSDFRFRQHF
jgi:NADPH2:quinone reductase